MSDSGSGASLGVQNYQTSIGGRIPTIRHLGPPDPSALAWCWCNRDRRPQFPPQKLKNGRPRFRLGFLGFLMFFLFMDQKKKVWGQSENPESCNVELYPDVSGRISIFPSCQRH